MRQKHPLTKAGQKKPLIVTSLQNGSGSAAGTREQHTGGFYLLRGFNSVKFSSILPSVIAKT